MDGALAELAYALDTLGLDGVFLQSNYNGLYLGVPEFDALFDQLNHHGAVMFVHPVSPPNFAPLSVGLTAPILEYPFDTTRMATTCLAAEPSNAAPI